MNFVLKNGGFCINNGDFNANIKEAVIAHLQTAYGMVAICITNDEFSLKNDEFRI